MEEVPKSGDEPHGLYEPLLSPFQVLSDDNRGPVAFTTATTLIVITSLTVFIKLWTVWATTRKLALNDGIMILALIFGIVYTACLCRAVQDGLGLSEELIDEARLERLSRNYYASNILLVLALACAKSSITLLIISIQPLKMVRFACYGTLAFCVAWGIGSAITLALQCSPNRWALGPSDTDSCINQYTMQIAIRACDVASDIAIVVLPIVMMQAVQITRLKRTIVILLFSLRIVTPVITLISLLTLSPFYDAPSIAARPFLAVTPSVYTTLALNLSIITACIPSIKRFLADWASGLSKAEIQEGFEMEVSAGTAGYGTGSRSAGYGTGSVSGGGSGNGNGRSRVGGRLDPRLWGISGGKGMVGSMGSMGSRGAGRSDERFDGGAEVRARGAGSMRKANGGKDKEEESESVKGLTDGVILHTIDYKVEFEERDNLGGSEGRDGSTTSSARDRDGRGVWEGRPL